MTDEISDIFRLVNVSEEFVDFCETSSTTLKTQVQISKNQLSTNSRRRQCCLDKAAKCKKISGLESKFIKLESQTLFNYCATCCSRPHQRTIINSSRCHLGDKTTIDQRFSIF